MIRSIADWLLRALACYAGRLAYGSHAVRGVEIVSALSTDQDGSALRSIGKALELLAEHWPLALRRVQREIGRVLIVEKGRIQHLHPFKGCSLTQQVVSLPPEQVALVLVHEAAHGQIARWGTRQTDDVKERIERACVKRELALIDRLPEGREGLRDWVEQRLATEWWTEESTRERNAALQRELLR